MTTYNPDRFLVLKIEYPEELLYKVFGTWYGGYTTGDSWRMNSGISRVEQKDDRLLFHGHSGSVYDVHKDSYGASGWSYGIVNGMIENGKVPVEVLDENTDWLAINY